MPKLVKSKSGTGPEPGNKVIIQRNFTLFGGIIAIITLLVYLVSAIYPSRLFSEARDNELATQFSVHPAVPDSPLKTEMTDKFASINATWAKLFNRAGKHYTAPQLQLFKDSIIAYECGIAKPASGPFYGTSNKEVYLDLGFIDTIQKRFPRSADMMKDYVIAHQIGHYIAGLLSKVDNSNRTNTEQLADYYAGVWAHYAIKQNDYADDMTVAISNVTQLSNHLAQNDKISVPDVYEYSMLNGRSNWFYKGYESGNLNGPKKRRLEDNQDQ
jgi:hypothetical protein